MINVTVWNEFFHENHSEAVNSIYPEGIHGCIKNFLEKEDGISVRTATLNDPECGLSQHIIDNTDVLIWWGHMKHEAVPDAICERVRDAVVRGMGVIFLHSAHFSKPFKALMGTSCSLCWREDGEKERVWAVDPSHPIAKGLNGYFTLPHEEMYGEPFNIPEPEKLVFLSWYEGGEVFRSGCCWQRGAGKIFYFQPGHEEYPTYYIDEVQTVIKNAVYWCNSGYRSENLQCRNVERIRD